MSSSALAQRSFFTELLEGWQLGVRYRVDNSDSLVAALLGWMRIGKPGFTMNLQLDVVYRTDLAQTSGGFCASLTSWVSNGLVLKPGLQLGCSF